MFNLFFLLLSLQQSPEIVTPPRQQITLNPIIPPQGGFPCEGGKEVDGCDISGGASRYI